MSEIKTSNKFYDVHMHAFNLGHPNLSAFIKRFFRNSGLSILICSLALLIIALFFPVFVIVVLLMSVLILGSLVFISLVFHRKYSSWFFSLIVRLFRRHLNLLALMENDLGNYFLLTEDVLVKGRPGGKLAINGATYDKIVLTPLMMDFGSKNIMSPLLPYGAKPIRKPIAQQVTDVFNGIATYVRKSPHHLFEIYPFLGVNPRNYSLAELKDLLTKYFDAFEGKESALRANMGAFEGDIERLSGNFFAGIKVYPPLGFDPWPEEGEQWQEEREKVRFLYAYCCEKRIPVTAHCNDGGFLVDSLSVTHRRTTPEIWAKVLEKYPSLALNLAHMGDQQSVFRGGGKKRWQDAVFELAAGYENVYTDFSCMEFKDENYRALALLIDAKSRELKYDLTTKVLFGSDFMINLQWIGSYNAYIGLFRDTKHLGSEKFLYCSVNPRRYLFG